MLEIFTRYHEPNYSRVTKLYPEWRAITERLLLNYTPVITYLKSMNIRPNTTNNPLYRLIFNFADSIQLPDDVYYDSICSRLHNVGSHLGFITYNNFGKVFSNIIYKDADEMILENTEDIPYFNYTEGETWKSIKPLRIIYIENTDLDFNVLANRKSINGLVMYEINPKAALFQYKKWANYRGNYLSSIDPAIYLQQYLYPSALIDYLNYGIFNRLISIINTDGSLLLGSAKPPYPMFLPDITARIDNVLLKFYKDFKDKKVKTDVMLSNIPIAYNKDRTMLYYLSLNVIEINRYMGWVPYLTRMGYIDSILKFQGVEGIKFNKEVVGRFQESLKRYITGNIKVPDTLNPFYKLKMEEHMENIKRLLLDGMNLKIR